MLILVAPLLQFGIALVLMVLRFWRPRFRFGWLIAVATTTAAWVSIWLWQPQLPLSLSLPTWQHTDISSASLGFSADTFSWAYALSLVALALASLLTATARTGFPNPVSWIITLGLTGLGLLAVAAGNPLTLVLIWAALDLAELVAMLRWTGGYRTGGRAIGVFSMRAAGVFLLLLVQVAGSEPGKALDFATIPPQLGLLLVAAAALHVGVLPIQLPYAAETSLRRGIGTIMRLVSAGASLVLISRIQLPGLTWPVSSVLLLLCGIGAVYGGWMWLRAPDENAGRSFWVMALASFAVSAALRGNPAGAAGWGIALLLSGGVLFLASVPQTWLNRALLIGAWTISSLPFSLTSAGWRNDAGFLDITLPIFLVAQAFLLAGFVRRAMRPSKHATLESQSAWVRTLYPLGLLILIALQVLLGLWELQGAPSITSWVAGAAASLLSLILLWAIPRVPALNPVVLQQVRPSSESVMDRLYGALAGVAAGIRNATETITRTLEGESGIIWSLVLLILFISLIVERGR